MIDPPRFGSTEGKLIICKTIKNIYDHVSFVLAVNYFSSFNLFKL